MPLWALIFDRATNCTTSTSGGIRSSRPGACYCIAELLSLVDRSTLLLTVISMRPAALPPMETSKNTTGRDMVAVEGVFGERRVGKGEGWRDVRPGGSWWHRFSRTSSSSWLLGMETLFTYVLLARRRRAPRRCSLCFCCSLCAGYIHSPQLFPVSRASNMPTCQSTACIALAAVITLIAGVSDAFVAPSLSSKIDARGRSNTRAGRSSSCLSMGADGGTTRGEQRGDVVLARQRQQ